MLRNLLCVAAMLLGGVVIADTATVTMTILGANDAPVAADDAYSVSEDATISGNVLDNDVDVDVNDTTVVISVNGQPITPGVPITLPSGALLTINTDGTFTYDPNDQFEQLGEGEQGQDTFTYEITNPVN